ILHVPAGLEYRTSMDIVSRIPFYTGDRERSEQMTRDVVTGAAPHNEFEFRVISGQEQELRWIRARWKIFRDAHGIAQRVIGVFSDTTERKRAEEKLRSRQEMVNLAQRAAGAVAFEWRADAGKGGNRWSPDLEAMYGIPAGSYDGTEETLK